MRSVKEYNSPHSTTADITVHDLFREEVIRGLQSHPKYLSSKYFYDKRGDELFQQIMECPEYYLTDCELDIFSNQTHELAHIITAQAVAPFDLIELGAGDGTKSKYLLQELLHQKADFTYLPIDISGNVLTQLESNLSDLTNLKIKSLQGDYLDMLGEAAAMSSHRKVVLFLGANIGNMNRLEAQLFCESVHRILQPGDQLLIGFDLKKNPQTILDAYNDHAGITRDFNLNLLERINRELEAGFDLTQFTHYPMYDPETGACKSYLVSTVQQTVTMGDHSFRFNEGEWIFMEISQKYSIKNIQTLAAQSGFVIERNLTDQKNWFVDSIWKVI